MNYNKIENVIEKALLYATLAHAGQVRKNEPDKPRIVHPMGVATILKEYGADTNVISAGLLHDVVEDTNYTLEDIEKNFGQDIAHLVEVASELDKTKSWEERRKDKIQSAKKLNSREKLVIIADKINNIEDIARSFQHKGFRDFSSFNRGEEKQEWYYRNMYESLNLNEDKQNPLLIRLEQGINNAFGRTMQEYKDSLNVER